VPQARDYRAWVLGWTIAAHSSTRRAQEQFSEGGVEATIASESDEVKMASAIVAPQSGRHWSFEGENQPKTQAHNPSLGHTPRMYAFGK
jgi:hypothetical protein